jgi:hypothetical protein
MEELAAGTSPLTPALECLTREYARSSAFTNVALISRKGMKLPKTHSSTNIDATMMKDMSRKFCSMADKSR